MATKIKRLEDYNGDIFYPQTKTACVYTEDNDRLDEWLDDLATLVASKVNKTDFIVQRFQKDSFTVEAGKNTMCMIPATLEGYTPIGVVGHDLDVVSGGLNDTSIVMALYGKSAIYANNACIQIANNGTVDKTYIVKADVLFIKS